MRGGDGQPSGAEGVRVKIEKPRRRGYLRFEKVRLLFVPEKITVVQETFETNSRWSLYYGPKPEHFIRSYPTHAQALDKAHALIKKFGIRFMDILGPEQPKPSP